MDLGQTLKSAYIAGAVIAMSATGCSSLQQHEPLPAHQKDSRHTVRVDTTHVNDTYKAEERKGYNLAKDYFASFGVDIEETNNNPDVELSFENIGRDAVGLTRCYDYNPSSVEVDTEKMLEKVPTMSNAIYTGVATNVTHELGHVFGLEHADRVAAYLNQEEEFYDLQREHGGTTGNIAEIPLNLRNNNGFSEVQKELVRRGISEGEQCGYGRSLETLEQYNTSISDYLGAE